MSPRVGALATENGRMPVTELGEVIAAERGDAGLR